MSDDLRRAYLLGDSLSLYGNLPGDNPDSSDPWYQETNDDDAYDDHGYNDSSGGYDNNGKEYDEDDNGDRDRSHQDDNSGEWHNNGGSLAAENIITTAMMKTTMATDETNHNKTTAVDIMKTVAAMLIADLTTRVATIITRILVTQIRETKMLIVEMTTTGITETTTKATKMLIAEMTTMGITTETTTVATTEFKRDSRMMCNRTNASSETSKNVLKSTPEATHALKSPHTETNNQHTTVSTTTL